MKSLIFGFGVSGKGAFEFLKKRGDELVIFDEKVGTKAPLDEEILSFDQVVVSPGISLNHPLLLKAKRCGVQILGEAELGISSLKNRIFAITGSNGKTSSVTLAVHILKEARLKARALGNVGVSICGYLVHPDPEEILVIELSSYQLETLKARNIEVGVILNITPNHLDRYESFEEYAKAKLHLQNCIQEGGAFYVSSQVMQDFGSWIPHALCFEKELAPISELEYTGQEMASKQSMTAAYLLCKRCGVTDDEFLQGLKTYKKPPHRIEWVAKIDGVSYYNDSKSANIHSVIDAVGQMRGDVVLIAGGVHKGSSYAPWIHAFKGRVRKIIAYGQAASLLEKDLSSHFDFIKVDRFEEAVVAAKQTAQEGDVVLLSPGCSSFDQFENYEKRGEAFRLLVRGS